MTIALSLVVGLAVSCRPILTGIAGFMSVEDPLRSADLLLPLYQDPDTGPFATATLYRQRLAPRVALYRRHPRRLEQLGLLPPAHEGWRRVLESQGVPGEAIVILGTDIRGDAELAHAIAGFLGPRGDKRIIVVASAPSSRLARNALQSALAGYSVQVVMHPVRPLAFDEHTWWQSRAGWITYFDAYCLWFLRFVR